MIDLLTVPPEGIPLTTDAKSLPLMTTHHFPKTIAMVEEKHIKLYLGPCKIVKTLAGKLCLVSPVFGAGYFGTFRPNGDFTPTKQFTYEHLQLLINVEERGLEAIKAIGLLTGNCCICGRTLTAEGSIDEGIGPICAGKF